MKLEKTITFTLLTIVLLINFLLLVFTYFVQLKVFILISIIYTIIDSLFFIFKKTIIIFLLIKFYGIKSGKYILNSRYIEFEEIFGDKKFTGEKRIQKDIFVKINIGFNKIRVIFNSDESSSCDYSSIFTSYSLLTKKITYAYINSSNENEDTHNGIGVIDLKNKKIEYSNEYPRLSKGTIYLDKLNN